MCGVIGIIGNSPVNQQLFDGLTVLQHRGQDSSGIATENNGHLVLRKHNGLVREVFHTRHMERLQGNIGIGHVRYPTAGTPSVSEAQPFYVNSPHGIALAHNGNLVNSEALRTELRDKDKRHINTQSDSELIINILAQELSNGDTFKPLDAVENLFLRCKGGYAVVAMIVGKGLLAFRDKHGIRPLIYGCRKTNGHVEYCVASESVALDTLDFEIIHDLLPGEAIFIDYNGGVFSNRPIDSDKFHYPCLFEYVYLARPDSVIDNIYVHKARIRMGKMLARKIKREWPDYKRDIDAIIPIPSTSRNIALEMARHMKIAYRDGFVKNRYIGRTFIMPGQEERKRNIRAKLNPLTIELKDKNVLLVDDSIVRGNTSTEIVEMVRDAGAKKVYLASASPPIRYPNIYGIDMPSAHELIAHERTLEEIEMKLGVDRLIYQDLKDLIYAASKGNPNITHFDDSVFTGNYVTGTPNGYFEDLARKRSDTAKNKITDLDGGEYNVL